MLNNQKGLIKMVVNILGQPYEIIFRNPGESDPKLENATGYIEPYSKKLVIDNFEPDSQTVEKVEDFKRKVLRHEIVHAFLHESGLRENSWGDNEEIVDWIALQGDKIFEAWNKAEEAYSAININEPKFVSKAPKLQDIQESIVWRKC